MLNLGRTMYQVTVVPASRACAAVSLVILGASMLGLVTLLAGCGVPSQPAAKLTCKVLEEIPLGQVTAYPSPVVELPGETGHGGALPSRRPLVDVLVEVRMGGREGKPIASGRSDANGSVSLALPGGRYVAIALPDAKNLRGVAVQVVVREGEHVDCVLPVGLR